MSFTTLNILLAIMLLVLFWRDSLKVREIANRISRQACSSHGVQFLDQTVALRSMGFRWLRSGPRIRRTYQFDYSLEGFGRRTGYLVMLGSHSEALRLDLPESQ
jgi:hypothetical protein